MWSRKSWQIISPLERKPVSSRGAAKLTGLA
jgi:hypothetical protein